MDAFFLSDGTVNPPQGVQGGLPGGHASQFLRRNDGELVPLDLCGSVTVQAGERLVSISTGGGGYGRPDQREPERVADDVKEGLVTPQRARDVYAVAVDIDGTVDLAATRQLRGHRR
jgi:N-methylhydantoinase B